MLFISREKYGKHPHFLTVQKVGPSVIGVTRLGWTGRDPQGLRQRRLLELLRFPGARKRALGNI